MLFTNVTTGNGSIPQKAVAVIYCQKMGQYFGHRRYGNRLPNIAGDQNSAARYTALNRVAAVLAESHNYTIMTVLCF